MASAARTAPKTRGIDNIRAIVLDDPESRRLLQAKMREIAQSEKRPGMERDANCIDACPAIVVLGVESNPAGLDCGFCGQPVCQGLKDHNGVCAFNSVDLGIAASSAAGVAATFHMDNRMMYSIGRACLDLKLFGENVKQALGIPLSITGKSPFFDRGK